MIRKYRSSFHAKLFSVILLMTIYVIAVLSYQQFSAMTDIIHNEALEKSNTDLKLTEMIINDHYPGEWRVEGDQLLKGDFVMNNNDELIDQIGELTNGDTVTIFLGNKRIATNVLLDNGERAVGTTVADNVAKRVLDEGEVYSGTADVLGYRFQATYVPLKNIEGETVGILYVGAPAENERINLLREEMLTNIIATGAIVLVIMFVVTLLFTRSIVKRLKKSVTMLDAIAAGDLTQSMPATKSNDEIDQLIVSTGKMQQQLITIMSSISSTSDFLTGASSQLVESAEQTSQAAEQISEEIQAVAVGSEEQAQSIDTALQAIHEVSTGMEQTANVVEEMANFASTMNDHATSGKQVVEDALQQMELITQNVSNVSESIYLLKQESNEINEIITMITEIANQTNLLALNAAIEAARAGEHGRGFSVVAQEVRKLADQSLASAEKVQLLINQIQQQAEQSVLSMEHSSSVVEHGVKAVEQSGAVFTEMAEAIHTLTTQSEEISAIVQQVHANSDVMVQVMEHIEQVTTTTATRVQAINAGIEEQTASIEEVTASTILFDEMAKELTGLIHKFKVE